MNEQQRIEFLNDAFVHLGEAANLFRQLGFESTGNNIIKFSEKALNNIIEKEQELEKIASETSEASLTTEEYDEILSDIFNMDTE